MAKTKKRRKTVPESEAAPSRAKGRRWALAAGVGLVLALIAGVAGLALRGSDAEGTPVEVWKVVRTFPHDSDAYTQGLLWHDGRLYESTGQHGKSGVRVVELATGKVLRRTDMDEKFFGEGIALADGRIYQVTWQAAQGFVYDAESLKRVSEFGYEGEGWGLTTAPDGRIVMSDGTARLRWMKPEGFAETGAVVVHDGARAVSLLNELEWVRGEIWANVWKRDRIACIDPKSGRVRRWIDLSGEARRVRAADARAEVLNGIAWDAEGNRVFVTGKNWPVVLEIERGG